MAAQTDVRTKLRDALATALSLDFVDGKIDGPLRDVSIGCTFPDGYDTLEADANYIEYRVVARVILALDPNVTEIEPDDPGSLEAIAEAIAVTIGTQASSGTLVATYVTVHSAQYDVDANSVDVLISAQIPNPFDPG